MSSRKREKERKVREREIIRNEEKKIQEKLQGIQSDKIFKKMKKSESDIKKKKTYKN